MELKIKLKKLFNVIKINTPLLKSPKKCFRRDLSGKLKGLEGLGGLKGDGVLGKCNFLLQLNAEIVETTLGCPK